MKRLSIITLLTLSVVSCTRQDAPPAAVTMASITGMEVNLRDSPGTSGKVLGRLNRPEKVTVLEIVKTGDTDNPLWFKVTTAAEATGYVSSRYIATIDSPTAVKSGNVDGGQWSVKAENGTLLVREANGWEAYRDTYRGVAGKIVKSGHGNYLFIAVMDSGSVQSLLTLVIDMSMRKLVIKVRELDNPNALSVSPSKRYMLIDSGTSADIRGLTIVDMIKGKEAATVSYFPDKGRPTWISGNAFGYYMIVGRKAPGKPDLPQTSDGRPNNYARKIIWDDGRTIKKDDYTAVYSESGG